MSDTAPRRSTRSAGKPATGPSTVSAPTTAPSNGSTKKSTSASTGATKRKVEEIVTTASVTAPATATVGEDSASKKSKASSSSPGQLSMGDALPSLKLLNQEGSSIDVSSFRKTVIFTYPKANTSGCTTQAKLYRDNFTSFTSLGYTIYGLSNDSPTSLKNWKEKQGFQYDLLSDPKRELIKKLTGSADKTKRSHFVVDESGKLSLIKLSVKPPESSEDALQHIKSKI